MSSSESDPGKRQSLNLANTRRLTEAHLYCSARILSKGPRDPAQPVGEEERVCNCAESGGGGGVAKRQTDEQRTSASYPVSRILNKEPGAAPPASYSKRPHETHLRLLCTHSASRHEYV